MAACDFLVELGTEELPPKALKKLSTAFVDGIVSELAARNIAFGEVKAYAAPRRLGLLIKDLADQQPDQPFERKGPAVKAAFDAEGKPTKAAQGFASSCGVSVDALETVEEGKGAWLLYRTIKKGEATTALLPSLVQKSLDQLPIPKRMRWGAKRVEFVRPAHWLVMLYGDDVIDCEILGLQSANLSRGHRFHCNQDVVIESPASYAENLRSAYVVADFAERRQQIRAQVEAQAQQLGATAVIDEDLLDEVTALNEWPVALTGRFEERFLEVPAEALISTMKENQKYFHLVDDKQQLLPNFITIANIESQDPSQVIAGNERVVRPRLADAKFFFDTDRKTTLEAQREKLKPVVFQAQLGSLFDKTERIASLSGYIAEQIGADRAEAIEAGQLSKSDLNTEMVLEFTDLQGIMGEYYARFEGKSEAVAKALNEQYMPRFAGDQLPSGQIGAAVSISDKIDTLVGIFGIGQPPSGNKDPFGLRRATLGVLRIMVEKELNLDLDALLRQAVANYQQAGVALSVDGSVDKLVDQVLEFMLERFRAWYSDAGIPVEVFLAVRALKPTQPLDFNQRVEAVNHFRTLAEAETLAAANKRVSNILAKAEGLEIPATVNPSLLSESAEKALAEAVAAKQNDVAPLMAERDYQAVLESLASLKEVVDNFFEEVLVNAEDSAVRANRYALLSQLRNLFLGVADISQL